MLIEATPETGSCIDVLRVRPALPVVYPGNNSTRMLFKHFITGRLIVRDGIHRVSQGRQLQIHPATRPALIAQGAVFRDAMPGIVRKALGEGQLRGGIEFLPRNSQGGNRYAGR